MRGIVSYAGYVPYRRLRRADIADLLGGAPGRGSRSVASWDEDTTTMAVEAGRLALRATPVRPEALWLSTAEPAYGERTNATAVHAALRLDSDVLAMDVGSGVRSGMGALVAALGSAGSVLVCSAGLRGGRPGGADESFGGDGAAALLVGEDSDGPVVAEVLAAASATEEFLDRWRAPGAGVVRRWEDRFAETRYLPLGEQAWRQALKQAGVSAEQVSAVALAGVHQRAAKAMAGRLGAPVAPDLADTVGHTGAAHPGLLLASVLEDAQPDQVVAVVSLADGADVVVLRTTPALAGFRPARRVSDQVARGGPVSYSRFLRWRGALEVEPPNRPSPNRPSASAAARSQPWKFGFVGSRDRSSGILHLPPSRIGIKGGATDDMDPAPMADEPATITTFTVDRLIYSESPPVVFAVLDFEGGGRFACELTDVDAEEVSIGQRVEMCFRRLFSADGIHNYFWKARPQRY
jgi:hydroxymethylglutaryl-CoA synthase